MSSEEPQAWIIPYNPRRERMLRILARFRKGLFWTLVFTVVGFVEPRVWSAVRLVTQSDTMLLRVATEGIHTDGIETGKDTTMSTIAKRGLTYRSVTILGDVASTVRAPQHNNGTLLPWIIKAQAEVYGTSTPEPPAPIVRAIDSRGFPFGWLNTDVVGFTPPAPLPSSPPRFFGESPFGNPFEWKRPFFPRGLVLFKIRAFALLTNLLFFTGLSWVLSWGIERWRETRLERQGSHP